MYKVCENVEINRVCKLSKGEFEDEYLSKGEPIIIENAIDDWPAGKWTLDSLSERVGHKTCNVRWKTNTEEYKNGKQYFIRQTTLKEYISDIKAMNAKAKSSYMAVQNMKQTFPELLDDIKIPEYVGKLHGGPFMWIALQNHYEYCHFDPDDGLLIILNGQKHVRLYGCDIDSMYPNPKGTKGRTVQSGVNFDDPDWNMHPNFCNAKCRYGTLNSGDMLFIPAFWWHQVTSTQTTISVNMFFGDAGENAFIAKVMEPPRWQAFQYWLLNVVEQNRNCDSFNRMLSRLPEALVNFLKNQWYNTPDDAQVARLQTVVMEYLNLSELPMEPSSGRNPPCLKIRGLVWRS
ncbi:unnamed protein product [Owenia fusiformis]|uniref:Uncharacterized protein n=1 Tax=Owenia fusiformis TaxID=6347 RepID=A0A8J1TEP4_OWEFU|nr:unnamed protein product [Owenia fusiformis]